ncbi:V-type ATP synthase subunit E [Kribbella sp. VKM Ac-2568]|uniref:V-type ATP synthase subunit E n=1 Tax=Kribbella sp. VKM Ac-2568 TaxID=2512219 RepID=UPI0010480A8D|nr:V-type ATP synthase subunit E [Kribbella sp. VKM Ac-2568]TCM39512.1 V/A-type H+-transporting ATPase subunit E [Kribbella sp. VKM Ac-2568]
MALRDLLTALEEEGAAEHEKAQQKRRRQAAQLLADAHERAAKIHQDVVTAAEAASWQEAENLLITARFGARRAVRTARDDALEEVLSQVREQLLALPGTPDGPTMAAACLEEAVTAMPQATTVHLHPAHAATLSPEATVQVVADLDHGGAIAEDDQGRYVDNTYLTRLANTWPEIRAGLSHSWEHDA